MFSGLIQVRNAIILLQFILDENVCKGYRDTVNGVRRTAITPWN